jgi:kynurenine formamidase
MCLPGTVEAVREAHERKGVTRRAALAGGGAAAVAALMPAGAAADHKRHDKRGRGKVADLTHLFRAGFPMYTGAPPARETLVTIPANGFYAQRWTFGEHSGTHMDAPGHFTLGGRLTPELEPSTLIAPIAVIDVRRRAAEDPDTAVSEEDIRRHEKRYGRIPRGAAVLMRSGWESRVGDPVAYKNADAGGTYHFPGFGPDAADLLMRRGAQAIGVDTLSLDPGESTTFDVHVAWLDDERYGLENVANLGSIPARGATLTVGVIPWEEGSGGPCRLLATY